MCTEDRQNLHLHTFTKIYMLFQAHTNTTAAPSYLCKNVPSVSHKKDTSRKPINCAPPPPHTHTENDTLRQQRDFIAKDYYFYSRHTALEHLL